MTTLAIDIGGTKVLAALVEAGRVGQQIRLPTTLDRGPEGLIAQIAAACAPLRGRFDRVGAAVTGRVRDGAWCALNRSTLDLGADFALAEALEARLGRPALAVNDAQAAAWGEYRSGAGAGRDIVFLTLSTGLGGGVVSGGRLLGGLAGSFGQIRDEAGLRLEDGLAGRWFAAEARAAGRDGGAEAVFAAAREPWAGAIIDTAARRLATLCANIQLMLDPDRILLGGGIGLAPGFIGRVGAALAARDLPRQPDLQPAMLGAQGGLIGAADLAEAMLGGAKRDDANLDHANRGSLR